MFPVVENVHLPERPPMESQSSMFPTCGLTLFRQHSRLAAQHHRAYTRNREFALVERDPGMARRYTAMAIHHSAASANFSRIARTLRDGFLPITRQAATKARADRAS